MDTKVGPTYQDVMVGKYYGSKMLNVSLNKATKRLRQV